MRTDTGIYDCQWYRPTVYASFDEFHTIIVLMIFSVSSFDLEHNSRCMHWELSSSSLYEAYTVADSGRDDITFLHLGAYFFTLCVCLFVQTVFGV